MVAAFSDGHLIPPLPKETHIIQFAAKKRIKMLIRLRPNNPPEITGLKAKPPPIIFIWNLPYTDTTMTSKRDRKCMANESIDTRVALRLNSWQSGALGKL